MLGPDLIDVRQLDRIRAEAAKYEAQKAEETAVAEEAEAVAG